jgi:hypothetical protein
MARAHPTILEDSVGPTLAPEPNSHDEPAAQRPQREGAPIACRLGLHEWPRTFLRGATGVRCLRCGKRKGRRHRLPP